MLTQPYIRKEIYMLIIDVQKDFYLPQGNGIPLDTSEHMKKFIKWLNRPEMKDKLCPIHITHPLDWLISANKNISNLKEK